VVDGRMIGVPYWVEDDQGTLEDDQGTLETGAPDDTFLWFWVGVTAPSTTTWSTRRPCVAA
jgi:hypothetical protein